MSLHLRSAGAWRTTNNVYAKAAGAWRQVKQVYVRAAGAWRPVWSYAVQKSATLPIPYSDIDDEVDSLLDEYRTSDVSVTYQTVSGTTATFTLVYGACASSAIEFTGATILNKTLVGPKGADYPYWQGCLQEYYSTSNRVDYWRCGNLATSKGWTATITLSINSDNLTIHWWARLALAKGTITYMAPGT